MADLLMGSGDPTPFKKKAAKKKKKSKRRGGGLGALDDEVGAKHHLVHVNVNVVNSAGDGGKKKNEADDALSRLRGF